MSNLVEHARRELELAGLFDKDSDYGGMLGPSVMKVVEVFAAEGHSGFSAGMALELLEKLLRFQPLAPIGTAPNEWFDHGPGTGPYGERIWQNERRSTTFSRDGGKTWYDIDDPSLNNGDVWRREDA